MNVLVTTHGSLCKGLLESYEMIAGTNLAIHTLSLTDEGIETYSNQLEVLADKLIKEGQLLIMTDIKGGTPFNESYTLAMENPSAIQIMTGVNLPMLLETGLALSGERSIEELVEIGINAAKVAIENVNGQEVASLENDLEF